MAHMASSRACAKQQFAELLTDIAVVRGKREDGRKKHDYCFSAKNVKQLFCRVYLFHVKQDSSHVK